MWKIALGGRVRSRDQHRTIGDLRCSGGHSMWNSDGEDSVRLLRQNDPVPVVVGGDKFAGVISSHSVTVGREAGAQYSEDEEQKAGQ